MDKKNPVPLRGLRHLALRVRDLSISRRFYEDLIGMKVLWQPDDNSVYLSSGCDNLALHQVTSEESLTQNGCLDHFGFIAENETVVDAMFERVKKEGILIIKPTKRHRDQSYSFYMADPDGIVIQILYEPHISPIPL
ncbi:VOC family protein [Nitrospira defluvii]|nr:VOC family protein [Nitrospira defluvii]